jgi:acetyl esterase/lipase
MPSSDFHPDLRRLGRFLPKQIVSPRTLPFIRFHNSVATRSARGDILVLPLPAGVTVRLLRTVLPTERAPALLWIGGGYVMGTAAQDDKVCARFARELGATVTAVDSQCAALRPAFTAN